jgi:hypothetical protein
MSSTVTMQTVVLFASDGNYPLATLLADPGVLAAAANSLGNDMVLEFKPYYTVPSGTPTPGNALFLTFYVTAAFALNIIAGIPAFVTRLATSAPNINRVATYGQVIAFG